MILLTKLNSNKILLNLEGVKYLESTPDTIVFFLNGESIIVKESLAEIASTVIDYKAEIFRRMNEKKD